MKFAAVWTLHYCREREREVVVPVGSTAGPIESMFGVNAQCEINWVLKKISIMPCLPSQCLCSKRKNGGPQLVVPPLQVGFVLYRMAFVIKERTRQLFLKLSQKIPRDNYTIGNTSFLKLSQKIPRDNYTIGNGFGVCPRRIVVSEIVLRNIQGQLYNKKYLQNCRRRII